MSATQARPFRCLIVLVIVLVGLCNKSSCLVVLSPPSVANLRWETPEYNYLPNPKPITEIRIARGLSNYITKEFPIDWLPAGGELVSWVRTPVEDRDTAFVGKILFSDPNVEEGPAVSYISYEETWRRYRALGPIAIIYANTVVAIPGQSEVSYENIDHSEFDGYLVVEMGREDGFALQKIMFDAMNTNETVTVRLDIGDRNSWRETRHHPVFYVWQAFFALLAACCAILAFAKLVAFIRKDGVQFSLPQLCLFLQWTANTIRIVYFVLDPIFLNRFVFNHFSQSVLVTLTWPAQVITTLLVSLYWHEAITKSDVKIRSFLSRLKIPFIICSISYFVSVLIAVLANFVIIFSVTIYFFYVSTQTLKQLNLSTKVKMTEGQRRRKSLRKITVFVTISGAFNMVWVIAPLIAAAVFNTPIGFYISFTVSYIGIQGAAFALILTFKIPKQGSSSSTS